MPSSSQITHHGAIALGKPPSGAPDGGFPDPTGSDSGPISSTLPRLKHVGFSVPRGPPSMRRSYTHSLSVWRPKPPVPVCPTGRIWRRRLSTFPTAPSWRWLGSRHPRRFLFLQSFPPGRTFSRQPATLSCQRAIPEGTERWSQISVRLSINDTHSSHP